MRANLTKIFEIQNDHRFIQVADPFLREVNGILTVYYEKKHFKKPGTLHLTNLKTRNETKVKLIPDLEGVHLSFPFMFKYNGNNYMLPESHEKEEISVYKENANGQFEKHKVLLKGGAFVDSILWQYGDLWFLMTTEMISIPNAKDKEYVRRLFYSIDLEIDFTEHPGSPVTKGRKYGRLGGALIDWNGKQYIPVQNCSNRYGEDINLFEINEISEHVYAEELYLENVLRDVMGFKWGGHHLHVLDTESHGVCLAVDVNGFDSLFNKVLRKFIN